MKDFFYNIPTKVYFGKDSEVNVGQYIKQYNPNKVLIHYGSNRIKNDGLFNRVVESLNKQGISYIEIGGVQPNPRMDLVYKAIDICKKEGVDFVLAIGGGSVLDSAKAIAHGVANANDDVWDYALGKSKPSKTLHKAAILTIASAGSEMSNSCVLSKGNEKYGFSSDLNRMDFAIENPQLTYSVSKHQTACGAVDSAMHSIERYFNPGQCEITDDIALAIIKNAFKYGKLAYDNPNDYEARANMMWISSLAHNGISSMGKQSQLVVHQFEHEISGMYPNVAHAEGLSAIWCSWARYVYKYNLAKWIKYAKEVWNTSDIEEAINKQEQYYKDLCMPTSLKDLDVKQKDLDKLALRVSNNKTRTLLGDKQLDYQDMLNILKKAFK